MSRSLYLCLVLASLGACAKSPPLIEAARVGQVAIGAPADAIRGAYPEERRRAVDLGLEGMPAPAIELMPEGATQRDALVAELIEQDGVMRVWRIQVRDPLLETARGVGVGDSVGDLRTSYALDRLIGGEGNVGIRVEGLSATFLLEPDGVQWEWIRAGDANRVPDDVKIRRILLTGTPVEPAP